jgi:uncharacterized protein
MRIGIIADTHDNLANTKRAAQWLSKEKIETIIHCGDIFKPETIEEIQKELKDAKIHIIFTPADASFCKIPENSFSKLKNVKTWTNFGVLKIDNIKIGFCHFPEVAQELVGSQEYDFVFYGHTHKPWLQKTGKTNLINPGNLAGIFYRATFAIYDSDTGKLELKLLEKV